MNSHVASPRMCRQYRQSEDEQLWPMAVLTLPVLSADPWLFTVWSIYWRRWICGFEIYKSKSSNIQIQIRRFEISQSQIHCIKKVQIQSKRIQIHRIWQKWLNPDLNPNLDLSTIDEQDMSVGCYQSL